MGKKPAGREFLQSLLTNAPTTCVIWPLFRDPNGYGRVGNPRKGRSRIDWAHRLMCEMANGPAPSKSHEAAHSCGNGKEGCVNPRHLSWQTRMRNQLDRKEHGTAATGAKRKLTLVDVSEIRVLKDYLTQREIAAMFNVTDATIRDIYSGKSWGTRKPQRDIPISQAEIDEIVRMRQDGMLTKTIGERFDISPSIVSMISRGAWRPKRAA